MQLAKRVANITPSSTLAITAKAAALKSQGYDIISLGAGEPDFNTPTRIIQAAGIAAKAGYTKYTPSGGLPELRQAIADKLKRDQHLSYEKENIVVTTGAKHALYLVFQSYLNPGDEVIIPSPYWVSYPEQVKLAEGKPIIVETTENSQFKLTIDQLKSAVSNKTKALILNSPSNPTGMIYSRDELQAIGDFCLAHNLLIVSDEIYEKLIYGDVEHISIAQLSPELKDQTVVINGVSKSHAMTGWRIGYAAGHSKLIKAMTSLASHSTSNPTSISQYAALEAYQGPQDDVEQMRSAFESRLNEAYDRLITIPGLNCIKPQGAFYLFPHAKQAAELTGFSSVDDWVTALLEEEKVALIPGSGFGKPDYVRLSYATSQENINSALDRINHFMTNHVLIK